MKALCGLLGEAVFETVVFRLVGTGVLSLEFWRRITNSFMKGGMSSLASLRTFGLVGKIGGLEAEALGLVMEDVETVAEEAVIFVLIGGDTCRRFSTDVTVEAVEAIEAAAPDSP